MEQNNESTVPEGTSTPLDESTMTPATPASTEAATTPIAQPAAEPAALAAFAAPAAPATPSPTYDQAASEQDFSIAAPSHAATEQPTAAQPDAAHLAAGAHKVSHGSRPIRLRTALFMSGAVAAIVLAAGGGGVALGANIAAANAANSAAITASGEGTGTTQPGVYTPTSPFGTTDGSGATGTDGSATDGSTGTSTQSAATAATDAQKVGVVTIVSDLYYSGNAEAAGTGIVLTSDGRILTNNHVIAGSTTIKVTVESTGKTYTASVVGSDTKDDIAVLQLDNASGLATATTDTSSTVAAGDTATSIGNAEGTGNLVAAAGTVTALDQSITVGNESTGASESLTGLIEVNADVVSGDSGGPLVDSDGEVIGIVTAASSGSADVTGYAIPITTALSIATQITNGDESGNITIGLPAFFGIEIATTQGDTGVTVGSAIDSTPAAKAGIVKGDVITAVDGASVSTAEELSTKIAAHEPGDSVKISYTTASGKDHTVTVTLTEGPAA